MRPALVMGFGPFLGFVDNPARRLALAVDGRRAGGLEIVGREMPVSFDRSVEETARFVEEIDPALILGVGVAGDRLEAMIERVGRRRLGEQVDVDGVRLDQAEVDGPICVEAGAVALALAPALGVLVSEDAGSYVCNAWLYRALRRFGAVRPVAFLHIPRLGFSPETLTRGLASWWAGAPLEA